MCHALCRGRVYSNFRVTGSLTSYYSRSEAAAEWELCLWAMQGSLRVAVAPSPAACVAVLSALGAAGECSHGRQRRRAAHSSVCRPSIPTLQSSLFTACSYAFLVCKCVHPAYTTTCPCVPGEWPRVISLLDDFNDWEVRRCEESRHYMHRVQVGGRTYV